MQREERFGRADRVIRTGFWINAVLMVMKLAAGYFGHSEAVFADGLESGCDFIALLATMIALAVGRRPFDEGHPYGHGKAENISAIVVSLIIFLTGAAILFNAARTIVTGVPVTPGGIAVIAALITIVAKELLFRYSIKTGKELQSPALLAIAKDHRKDALTSIATLAGVTGGWAGYGVLDPVAAGVTAIFIFHIAWEGFRTAAHDLMDAAAPEDLLKEVTLIAEGVSGVERVHEIRGRCSGQYVIIDLKLDMDPKMTVKNSHDVATRVKQLVFGRFPNVGDVMIHVNPHEEEHEDLIRL